MATIIEVYCSYEVAKLLKEKGFDERCRSWYSYYGDSYDFHEEGCKMCNSDCIKNTFMAPTQTVAMKWLREVYKIHIIAEPCLGEGDEPNLSFNRWFWTILKEEGEYEPIRKIEEFSTYEEAVEAAIKYCLDNLI